MLNVRSKAAVRSYLNQISNELLDLTREQRTDVETDDALEAVRVGPLAERLMYFLRDEKGDRIDFAPIHLKLCEHLEDCRERRLNCGVLMPVGHGKTTVAVVGDLLDRVGLNVNMRAQIISAGQDIAIDRLEAITSYMTESREYRELYPHVSPRVPKGRKRGSPDDLSKKSITIERDSKSPDPTIRALGILSKSTGSRADLQKYDDVEDIDSLSDAIRNSRSRAFWNKHLKRLAKPNGVADWSCTPWHTGDLNHRLPETTGWAFLVMAIDMKTLRRIRWVRIVNERPSAADLAA